MIEFRQSAHGELHATIFLNSWQGARDASGPYTSSQQQTSDGLIEVVFLQTDAIDHLTGQPSEHELKAIEFLQDNERTIANVLFSAVWKAYPPLRRWLQNCGVPDNELAEIAPPAESPEDIRRLIGLGRVYVLCSMADETPYLGFELGCSWDVEHGLGAVFRGVELIEIGGADTAFNERLPTRDRILRNLTTELAHSEISSHYTPSRDQALWKHAPWMSGPTPDIGLYDGNGTLSVAIDITDFHWEGPSRWWLHFVQYRNEPQSFARITISAKRPEAWIWKRESPDEKDWVPIREAKGLNATLNDESGISLALAPLYSGIPL